MMTTWWSSIHFVAPASSPSILLTQRRFSAKFRCAPPDTSPLVQQSGGCCSIGAYSIPHPKKVEKGGEDAYFLSDGRVFAVADGVSGWAEQNVDPSLYSRQLIANISALVENGEADDNPLMVLRRAHESTACTGSATLDGLLKVASVGDCGLRVIRRKKVVFSTTPVEHFFDCPFQLSSEASGQTYLDAVVTYVHLQQGDAIVMGSDGLFDNVFDDEIVTTVSNHVDPAEAAKALATLASVHSADSTFDSPYALEARTKGLDLPWWKKTVGIKLSGGKPDDITVIVGHHLNQ